MGMIKKAREENPGFQSVYQGVFVCVCASEILNTAVCVHTVRAGVPSRSMCSVHLCDCD